MRNRVLLLATLCSFSAAFADIIITHDARKDLQVTLYRGYAVVFDTRQLNVPEGLQRIRFEGVASAIEAGSVLLDIKDPSVLDILDQSYEYDLISSDKLLEKYVGKELEVIPDKKVWGDSTLKTVELISVHGSEPVFRMGTKLTFGNIGQILFPYMPENLYTQPTLIWNVSSPRRQTVDFPVTYIANDLNWNANYTLELDASLQDGYLTAWVSLDNRSGYDYENALFSCIAGDAHKAASAEDKFPRLMKAQVAPMAAAVPREENIGESEAGEYRCYAIKRRMSLHNNESKQVEWLPRTRVKGVPRYVISFNSVWGAPKENHQALMQLVFDNKKTSGLGSALPRGIVRMYGHDGSASRFLGEDNLDDTQIDASFTLATGGVFDISGSCVELDQKRKDDRTIEITREVTIKNAKAQDVTVLVRDKIEYGWKLMNCALQPKESDVQSAAWQVAIKAKSSYTFAYTVQIKN